jgi:hypothetical protein
MSVSVNQLEAKLLWLKTEVDEALEEVKQKKQYEALTPEEREAVRIERVRAENRKLHPYFEEALKNMISDEEPLGAEELQAALIAEGMNPEDNLFSRTLIEMRDE